MINPFNGREIGGLFFIQSVWSEKQIYLDNLDQDGLDAIWSILRVYNKGTNPEHFERKESVDGSALRKILQHYNKKN